jgi:hypothetical protein
MSGRFQTDGNIRPLALGLLRVVPPNVRTHGSEAFWSALDW